MTLDEIRLLLRFKDAPDENCGEVNALLDAHIGHVATRLDELRDLERELKRLRTQCRAAQDAGHCGILADLSRPSTRHESGPAKPRDLHVPGPTCEHGPDRRYRKT
jgi:hypothetical protein